jgi:hypothetical protein
MGGVGTAYDTAAAESLFATIKRELVHRHRFPPPAAAQLDRLPEPRGVRKEVPTGAGGRYRCLARTCPREWVKTSQPSGTVVHSDRGSQLHEVAHAA